jgi:hypothetical protein
MICVMMLKRLRAIQGRAADTWPRGEAVKLDEAAVFAAKKYGAISSLK